MLVRFPAAAPRLPRLGAAVALSLLALGPLASLASCAAEPEGWAALDGPGGEAWLFERAITGRADPECDEVVVESARGRVLAEGVERFAAEVPLPAGPSEVVAICRIAGREIRSEPQRWTVRLADLPRAQLRLRLDGDGDRLLLDGRESRPSEARPEAALTGYRFTAPHGAVLAEGGPTARLALPRIDGEYQVALEVTDADGRTDRAAAMFWVEDGQVRLADPDRPGAAWIDRAVVYGVVPFFFAAPAGGGGSGRVSGLAGVTDRLDELDALGVDTLWLSPITAAPQDDFGYAVADHFALSPRVGTPDELRRLVDEAHGRGMRVVMDFVPNHTSDQHPYFVSARERPDSSYAHFYDRGGDGEVTHYFDWENLPNLEYEEAEVERYMIEALSWWVRTYGIDGFRADAAWGPAARNPEVWPRITAELLRQRPDLLLLAEAGARDPYWGEAGFHAAYDWSWELGRWAWGPAFEALDAGGEETAAALRALLAEEAARGGGGGGGEREARVFRFLNNNDTGARFITRHGAGAVPVATALLFTLPGLPALFTGDEVGAEYEPYDEGPPVRWVDAAGVGPLHARAIALRREVPALRAAGLAMLEVPDGSPVVAFVRSDAARASGEVLVLLNFGEEPARISLPARWRGTLVHDRWSGEDRRVPAGGAFVIPGRTPVIVTAR